MERSSSLILRNAAAAHASHMSRRHYLKFNPALLPFSIIAKLIGTAQFAVTSPHQHARCVLLFLYGLAVLSLSSKWFRDAAVSCSRCDLSQLLPQIWCWCKLVLHAISASTPSPLVLGYIGESTRVPPCAKVTMLLVGHTCTPGRTNHLPSASFLGSHSSASKWGSQLPSVITDVKRSAYARIM